MTSIRELPGSSVVIGPDTLGRDVNALFKGDPKLAGVIVVDEGGQIEGAISRSAFFSQMSRRTGFEIFANRSVRTLLQHIGSDISRVDADLAIFEVVERCLSRRPGQLYEPVLVEPSPGDYRLVSFNELILAQSQMLASTMEQIAEKNQQVEDSIRYAERIQKSMIFNTDREIAAWARYATLFHPRDIVSGDFYWMTQANDRCYFVVADCTGHGVPGAFMSLIGHGHLSTLVINERFTDPALILRELHRRVRRSLHQEQAKDVAYDGMEVAMLVVDRPDGHLHYAGAKRPLAFTTPDGDLTFIKGDRHPIGGKQRERERVFTTLSLPVDPSATYYLFSDGITDQCDPENRKFGTKRLKETLVHIAPLPLPEKLAFLENALSLFQKDAPQRDDMALLAIAIDTTADDRQSGGAPSPHADPQTP